MSGNYRSRDEMTPRNVAWWHGVFDFSPLPIIKINTEGNCEYANKRFGTIVGEPHFAGRNVRELFPDEENRCIVERQLRKRFEELQPDEYKIVVTRLDNERRVEVEIVSTPELDSSGRVVGAIAVFRDLSVERAIQQITEAIANSHHSRALLSVVANQLRKLISFDQLHVAAYSRDGTYVRSLFANPKPDPPIKIRWFKMSTTMATFARRHNVERFNDMGEFYNQPGFFVVNEEQRQKQGWGTLPLSLLRCPIVRKGRVVASLSLTKREGHAFSDSDEEIFASLPLREAVSMVLFFEEKENLRFRLALMESIFTDWDDQEKVASVIVNQLLEHHDWDHAAFFHVDEKRQKIRLLSQKAKNDDPKLLLAANYEQNLQSGVLGYVYQNLTPVNIGNLDSDIRFKPIVIRAFEGRTVSELCLPIVLRDRVCWMLNVEDFRENAFAVEEVAALEVILEELKNLLDGVLSRHFLDTTIDCASDAIIAVDGAGCVNRVNSAVQSLLGYSLTDLNGVSFLEVLGSRERELLDEVTDGRRLFFERVMLKRKDGTSVEVLLSASPLPQALGGAVFLARDLSLMNRLQRLEFVGRLYRELAIQTKTPLSLALSWLDPLLDHEHETVGKIIQELRKVELTYDRLALYEQNEGSLPTDRVLLNVSEITNRTLDSLPEHERTKIRFTKEGDLPWVRGDFYQLTFCLRTILSYLLRFVPEKGQIAFTVNREDELIVISISGIVPELSDSGLPREDAEPLHRVRADIALGEDVLRSFIHANDGVYSPPQRHGQRLDFRIALPALAKETL